MDAKQRSRLTRAIARLQRAEVWIKGLKKNKNNSAADWQAVISELVGVADVVHDLRHELYGAEVCPAGRLPEEAFP